MKLKLGFVLLSVGILFSACKSKKNALHSSSDKQTLQVQITEQPCGGAMPTDEILEQMVRPHPYSNEVIYISVMESPMKVSNEKEYQLDKAGMTEISLDTGLYLISFMPLAESASEAPDQKKKDEKEMGADADQNPEEDSAPTEKELCERQWKFMSAFPLKIKKGQTAYLSVINKECNPCEPPKP